MFGVPYEWQSDDRSESRCSAEGAELAASIPFNEPTSLPIQQMVKLKVRQE
jgi:hypothetical protein